MMRELITVPLAALLAFALTSPVYAGATKVQGNFVAPPTTLDAGSNLAPVDPNTALVADDINDAPAVPGATGCPLPGVGACAADPNITCSLAPGSAANPFDTTCPHSGGACGFRRLSPRSRQCCVEALTGPDGVTSADEAGPSLHLANGKSKFKIQVKGSKNAANELKVQVQCLAKDVYDGDDTDKNNRVSTDQNIDNNGDPIGTCQGGPNDGATCKKNHDCKDSANPKAIYFCTDGDEYNCTIDGLLESNSDDCPACGGGPAKLSGCWLARPPLRHSPGHRACAVAACDGGPRDGQPCDILGTLSCPGGAACLADGINTVTLTGDEAGFAAPLLPSRRSATKPISSARRCSSSASRWR